MIQTNLMKASFSKYNTSSKKVAGAIGISEQQLSKIINNKVGCDISRAISIAKTVGMTRDEFNDIFLSNSFMG